MKGFGDTLSRLMKEANLTRPALAERMNVSVALVDKWKSDSENKQQQRRPSYQQFTQLVRIFAPQLNPQQAQVWGSQAGYQLPEPDLAAVFQPVSLRLPPVPQLSVTYNRLEPLPLHPLFGIDPAQAKLLELLNHQEDYWLLVIDGNGGIGKTALANVLVREILRTQRFYDVLWISAKQEEFIPHRGTRRTDRPALEASTFTDKLLEQLDPAFSLARSANEKSTLLTYWLKTHPYLIVIDNLETVSDHQVLLPILSRLVQPTKFLLTSREQVEDAYSHTVRELDRAATIDF